MTTAEAPPTPANAVLDRFLARALRGSEAAWPQDWAAPEALSACAERALYHGIAGPLLQERNRLRGWPDIVLARLGETVAAQSMWEELHRRALTPLLAELAQCGIASVILKGTALAYDLYAHPADRPRGDTDLLIFPRDLEAARSVLRTRGFAPTDTAPDESPAGHLQEVWTLFDHTGARHDIDLHWQLMNSPALAEVLSVTESLESRVALPALGEGAFALSRTMLLLHAAMHRAAHLVSPYFVGDAAHYGGDRLIWAYDIHLLAQALGSDEWAVLGELALAGGVAAVCLDGLELAQAPFGTAAPPDLLDRLRSAPPTAAADYLLHSGQVGRALHDFAAVKGARRKLSYLMGRALPSPGFMRSKYPDMRGRPLALLHARRVREFLRARPMGER